MIKTQNVDCKQNIQSIYLQLENSSENRIESARNKKNRASWNVKSSKFSLNTTNPIRAIVEHLNVQPNPEKTFIPLSVGK